MNFKTNLSKFTLLSNTTIKIYLDDKTIEFVPPSMETYFNDLDFIEFKFFLKYDYKQEKNLKNFIIQNEYEFFLLILKEDFKKDIFLSYFSKLFPNLVYTNSNFFVEDKALSYEEYLLLLDFLAVSCGEKLLDDLLSINEPDQKAEEKQIKDKYLAELDKKMKSGQQKLDDLKKSKKQKQKDSLTIDQIVIAILYEFPSFKLEDILRMNVYSVLYLWEYISKVVDTEIQKIAAGNGLLKQFTYFIN